MVHCATVFFTTIVCFSSQPLFCLCSYSFLCRYNKEYIFTVVGASYTVINTANNLCGAWMFISQLCCQRTSDGLADCFIVVFFFVSLGNFPNGKCRVKRLMYLYCCGAFILHTHTHTHRYVCTHRYAHTDMYACTQTGMHTHKDMYACMHACIQRYACMHTHTEVCIHTHTDRYTYTHRQLCMYTQTGIHTQTSMHTPVCIHPHTHVWMRIHTRTCMHAHTQTLFQ